MENGRAGDKASGRMGDGETRRLGDGRMGDFGVLCFFVLRFGSLEVFGSGLMRGCMFVKKNKSINFKSCIFELKKTLNNKKRSLCKAKLRKLVLRGIIFIAE